MIWNLQDTLLQIFEHGLQHQTESKSPIVSPLSRTMLALHGPEERQAVCLCNQAADGAWVYGLELPFKLSSFEGCRTGTQWHTRHLAHPPRQPLGLVRPRSTRRPKAKGWSRIEPATPEARDAVEGAAKAKGKAKAKAKAAPSPEESECRCKLLPPSFK